MGWADCGTDSKGRPIGYAHEATCDESGCEKKIDRGLSFACGGMHGDGPGCEGYFCAEHLYYPNITDEFREDQGVLGAVCGRCSDELEQAEREDHPCSRCGEPETLGFLQTQGSAQLRQEWRCEECD